MRILIFGAGVLGSRYAVALHQAGHDVTILARGGRFRQLKEHGIILEAINTGEITVEPVPVVDALNPEDAYDLVLVLMRSSQVADILPVLAANQHTPNVVFLGNNIHGPQAMVQALGRERVLLGFAAAAGVREGHTIRYISNTGNKTYIGELDGKLSPRLQEIQGVFLETRFPVQVFEDIEAWLKTHVAVISPLAYGVYMCAGDNYRLAHTRDALVLMVRGIRESLRALKALGYRITPPSLGRIASLPEPLLVLMFSCFLNTESAEIGLAGHANAARDEMEHLAKGLWELVQSSGVPAPSLRSLYLYRNPNQPPVCEGSQQIEMNKRELWIGLGMLAGGLGLLLVFIKVLLRRK